jgi:hypothetical protein
MLKYIEQVIFEGYREKTSTAGCLLKESNPEAKCKKAKLAYTGEILAYKFDKKVTRNKKSIKDLFPMLNDLPNLKKMCDFIVFYERNNKLFVILCNLKSNNADSSSQQMKVGELLAEFIVGMTKRLFADQDPKINEVEICVKPVLYSATPLRTKYTTNTKDMNNMGVKNYISNECTCDICDLDTFCH